MVMVRVLPVMDVVMDFVFRISMRNGRGAQRFPCRLIPNFIGLGQGMSQISTREFHWSKKLFHLFISRWSDLGLCKA